MIAVENLTIRLGAFNLEGLTLEVPSNCYGVLMGRTGSGKTTLLEAICGLRRVTAGRVLLASQDVTDWRPALRGIGYVPQDGALFPTMSVGENLGFGLAVRRTPKAAIAARVLELADWLGLGHLLDRRPLGLSGGEKQRVVLGRALAIQPSVLLLDEPLIALDDQTRYELYDLLRRVRQERPVTVLHVTHNVDDARELADRLWIMEKGKIQDKTETLARREPGVSLPGVSS